MMTAPGALALTTTVLILAALPCSAANVNPWSLTLEDATQIEDVRVPHGQSTDISLPAMPVRAGKLAVLRFGAVAFNAGPGGCNFNMTMRINGSDIERRTAAGSERLIGRAAGFQLDGRNDMEFSVFSGPRVMLMFAPDTDTANAMTEDDLGGTFMFDVSDMVSGVDGNTVTIVNTRARKGADGTADVLVERMQIGWLDRTAIPEKPSIVPERGEISASITADGLTLRQATAGGFSVAVAGGPELLVETGIGMEREAPPALLAQDGEAEGVTVNIELWSKQGFRMLAEFPSFRLTRTVHIESGLVEWIEEWTNTTDEIAGLPFRHRMFLRDEAARITLAGDTDSPGMPGSAVNPTVFVGSPLQAGTGLGVTAENDWLRLLMGTRGTSDVTEIYSKSLGLPPRGSIRFELTITPITDGGGYWSFINSVRRRWGVNGTTMERPLFWAHFHGLGRDAETRVREAFADLGPVYVTVGEWMGLSADVRAVRSGNWPKLPAGAAPTVGLAPDLDLAAFLTFKHREGWWDIVRQSAEMFRSVAPNVKIINMKHPAMEVVYLPEADRFPIAGEVIRTASGKPFHVAHYDRAHLGSMVDKDWVVCYYSPRPGTRYLQSILADCRRSMDDIGSDGIYSDEFSWAGRQRGYSRYDYSRWDGYSVDLDADGAVTRLKSDNAFTSESCQLQMTHESLTRDKFFLGNGGAALRSVNSRPIFRFIEGGNGHGAMSDAHLATVPLILGNFGDRTTREGVFASVRECLSVGTVYSPIAVNHLLDGPDNFVCKQYPLTVREIGPGWVVGEERLITSVARSFDWPGKAARVRLYQYDRTGALVSSDEVVDTVAGGAFEAELPDGGLLIAELVP